jgi:hypothetical protein
MIIGKKFSSVISSDVVADSKSVTIGHLPRGELCMLINRTSLSQTVDGVNAAYFEGRALAAERRQLARWIATRQGLSGAYGGTFAGFPTERSRGIVLFTGERIASASARHILGEEASRMLRLLQVRDRTVTRALQAADDGMMRCLARAAEAQLHARPRPQIRLYPPQRDSR